MVDLIIDEEMIIFDEAVEHIMISKLEIAVGKSSNAIACPAISFASFSALSKVWLETLMELAPRLFKAFTVFLPTSPVPITKIRLKVRLPKMRKAKSTATLPMLICPFPIVVLFRTHLVAWNHF